MDVDGDVMRFILAFAIDGRSDSWSASFTHGGLDVMGCQGMSREGARSEHASRHSVAEAPTHHLSMSFTCGVHGPEHNRSQVRYCMRALQRWAALGKETWPSQLSPRRLLVASGSGRDSNAKVCLERAVVLSGETPT
jgi:hypothetical protein